MAVGEVEARGEPVEHQRRADRVVQRLLTLRQKIVDVEVPGVGKDGEAFAEGAAVAAGEDGGLRLLHGKEVRSNQP